MNQTVNATPGDETGDLKGSWHGESMLCRVMCLSCEQRRRSGECGRAGAAQLQGSSLRVRCMRVQAGSAVDTVGCVLVRAKSATGCSGCGHRRSAVQRADRPTRRPTSRFRTVYGPARSMARTHVPAPVRQRSGPSLFPSTITHESMKCQPRRSGSIHRSPPIVSHRGTSSRQIVQGREHD